MDRIAGALALIICLPLVCSCDLSDDGGSLKITPLGPSPVVAGAQTDAPLGLTILPSGSSGQPYQVRLLAGAGVAPYTWSLWSGTPPEGLQFTPDGWIAGKAGASGTSTFEVGVTDALGRSGRQLVVITIAPSGPSTVVLQATKDVMVSSAQPAENVDSGDLHCSSDADGERHVFLDFERGRIPDGAVILSASLRLNTRVWRGMPSMGVHRVRARWWSLPENVLTWNTQPNVDNALAIGAPVADGGQEIVLDAQAFPAVSLWHGLRLSTTGPGMDVSVRSHEIADAAEGTYLVVQFLASY
ncbi:MAG: DNRLRE domain-containing protein [Planctomycetes bacterium]|nr:DNRLRE domain-containing protein [Planctomycetota bacterium]